MVRRLARGTHDSPCVSPTASDHLTLSTWPTPHTDCLDVCYKPNEWMSPEAREKKVELFNKGWCTVSIPRISPSPLTAQSHDPCTFIPKRDQDAAWNTNFPYGRPVLSDRAKKAVGLIPY